MGGRQKGNQPEKILSCAGAQKRIKILLQAKGNIPYCNKSWIVVPEEKRKVVLERYQNYLTDAKHIGVIIVAEGGKWEMIYRPLFKRELVFEQPLLNFLIRVFWERLMKLHWDFRTRTES